MKSDRTQNSSEAQNKIMFSKNNPVHQIYVHEWEQNTANFNKETKLPF